MTEVLYNPKIKPEHLARKAIVYLRQSTDKQVRQNKESRLLQYAVAERVRALGWQQVEIINSDLGSSAGLAAAEMREISSKSSNPSTPRRPAESGWDYRSAGQSSMRMGAGCGQRQMILAAPCFSSFCPARRRHAAVIALRLFDLILPTRSANEKAGTVYV